MIKKTLALSLVLLLALAPFLSFKTASGDLTEFNHVTGGDVEDAEVWGTWIKSGTERIEDIYGDSPTHSIGFEGENGLSITVYLDEPVLVSDIIHFTFTYDLGASQQENTDQYFNLIIYFSDDEPFNQKSETYFTYIGFGTWVNASGLLEFLNPNKHITALKFEGWTMDYGAEPFTYTEGLPSDVNGYIDDIVISTGTEGATPTPAPTTTASPTPNTTSTPTGDGWRVYWNLTLYGVIIAGVVALLLVIGQAKRRNR